jgi:hypothetical protein
MPARPGALSSKQPAAPNVLAQLELMLDDDGNLAHVQEQAEGRGRRMSRTAPYGRANAIGLTGPNELALRALRILLAEIDDRARVDPPSADRLCQDVLSLLLGPSGRAVLPYTSATIARLLAYRQGVADVGAR